MELQQQQEVAAANVKDIATKMCPIHAKPCLKELCWSYGEVKGIYDIETKLNRSRHIAEYEKTGGIMIVDKVGCASQVMPAMVIKAEKATHHNGHALFVREDGIVCYKDDATPVNQEDRANEDIPLDKDVITEEERTLALGDL